MEVTSDQHAEVAQIRCGGGIIGKASNIFQFGALIWVFVKTHLLAAPSCNYMYSTYPYFYGSVTFNFSDIRDCL